MNIEWNDLFGIASNKDEDKSQESFIAIMVTIMAAILTAGPIIEWIEKRKKNKEIKNKEEAKKAAQEYLESNLGPKIDLLINEITNYVKDYNKEFNSLSHKYKLNPRYNRLKNPGKSFIEDSVRKQSKEELTDKDTFKDGKMSIYIPLQDGHMRDDIEDAGEDDTYDTPGPIWNYHENVFLPFNTELRKIMNKKYKVEKGGIKILTHDLPTYGMDQELVASILL